VIERKLHFVVGKGGVGKTTVAAALARMLARRGRRTLAVEMDVGGRLPTVLGYAGDARTPVGVAPNLTVLSVDGRAALEEYLGMVIPVRRLLSTVFTSRIYQYFVAVAPGLKELMTVGKIWYEATRESEGRPAWDAIVVDAPATGHSLQYLRMPQAASETFGAGLVQREAARVLALLRDERRTAVHVVTLAEDMPVSETLETYAQLTGDLGMPLGRIVVNRVHERAFEPATVATLRTAAAVASGRDAQLLGAVADRAEIEAGWTAINAEHVSRLREAVGGESLVTVPFLFAEEFGTAQLDEVARRLEHALTSEAAAVRGEGRA
jgi:anion-transporting  ArsA/GET3 family ATPase